MKKAIVDLKVWQEEKKDAQRDKDFERNFRRMHSQDHELLQLIKEKLDAVRKLNEFLGEGYRDASDSLTAREHFHRERIHNFLNGGR